MSSHEEIDENAKPSYYAVITAEVRYCKNLEWGAMLLYGEITALATLKGYAWATNKYFAQLYDVDISTIKRWISSLHKEKFIEIETYKNGINWTRRLWLPTAFQKNFTKAQKCATPSSKMSHPQLKNEPHSNTSNTTYKKDYIGGKPPEPPKNEDFFIDENIQIEKSKYQKLIDEFSKDEVDKAIIEIKEWSAIKPDRFAEWGGKRKKSKCHGAAVGRWIRNNREKKGYSATKTHSNHKEIDNFRKNYEDNPHFTFLEDHIVFSPPRGGSSKLYHTDPQIKKRLIDAINTLKEFNK